MDEAAVLKSAQSAWLSRAGAVLTQYSTVHADLLAQLPLFFDHLVTALAANDPTTLDPFLDRWSSGLAEIEQGDYSARLMDLIATLMRITFETVHETVPDNQRSDLMVQLVPVFAHAMSYCAQREVQIISRQITAKLEVSRQNLEKLDKSKSDFITVAAHELKTPLTLVEGYTDMLRDSLLQRGEVKSDLALIAGIQNGAQRLRGIINDLIDVSLLDNRLMTLNFQPLWLNRLFAILESELRPMVQARQQRLIIKDFPGSADMTYGDPERLLQVFRNLIINAIKYTPDWGKIKIDGRRLPGFIEITVTDNGIGIDTDDQAIIFEKFVRLGSISLHSSGKTKFKGGGPGLGLHIAKGIIESHGGTIWVESDGYDEERCPGSTFHVLLPMHSESPDAKTARIFASLLKPADKSARQPE